MKKTTCHEGTNPSHEKELPRLNRAVGQLDGIRKMIEARRYCPEILIQLKAVRSAIKALELGILKSHLSSCVADSFTSDRDRNKKIDEIKELMDKFQS